MSWIGTNYRMSNWDGKIESDGRELHSKGYVSWQEVRGPQGWKAWLSSSEARLRDEPRL